MVIQHNLPGLNSKRIYNKNTSKLNKSLEKLYSEHAADNTDGLAVSKKMRSQIAGMSQEVRNSMNGASLVQTFEGALGETVAIIHRMKTLAEEAANPEYTDSDRVVIETEYRELCSSIDGLANTDYNGYSLLSGNADLTAVTSAMQNTVNGIDLYAMSTVRCGDLTIAGDNLIEGVDYSYANNTLTILSDKQMILSGTSTVDHVVVKKDVNANLTLDNLNLKFDDGDLYGRGTCAFEIEDNSKGNVHITLVGKNTLESGAGCAGLQKSGGVDTGTLTIDGNGELNAVGKIGGAGIGGTYKNFDLASDNSGCNITINSGTINATSKGYAAGAGIGGGRYGDARNITINGGKITATSDYSSGIGGGDCPVSSWGGNAVNIVINGGVIYAEGSFTNNGQGAGIGSCGGHETDITINGGKITAKGNRSGTGIGCCGPSTEIGGLPVINSHKITITGGEVLAISTGNIGSTVYGAGIGTSGIMDVWGEVMPPAIITISGKDTVVIAYSEGADDIGSGRSSKYEESTVTLNGMFSQEFTGKTELGDIINDLISETFKKMIAEANIPRGTVVYGGSKAPEEADHDPNDPTPGPGQGSNTGTGTGSTGTGSSTGTGTNSAGTGTGLKAIDGLVLQTGARSKDAVKFTFNYASVNIGYLKNDLDCTADGFGLNSLSLATEESAVDALEQIDYALNKASAIMSRLETAQRKIDSITDKLQESDPSFIYDDDRIKDTDDASELLQHIKQLIINNGGDGLMAQSIPVSQAMNLLE